MYSYRFLQKSNSVIELPAQLQVWSKFGHSINWISSLANKLTRLHPGCFLALHIKGNQYWILIYRTNSTFNSDVIDSFRLFPLLTARLQSSEVVTAVQSSSMLVRLCYLGLLVLTCCQGDQVWSWYWVPMMEPCCVWRMHQTQLHIGKLKFVMVNCYCGVVFNWVSWNQNQSNHSGQWQISQTIQWTNQNWKLIHVADLKCGKVKTRANESRLAFILLLRFDDKETRVFLSQSLSAVIELLSTLNSKLTRMIVCKHSTFYKMPSALPQS